jgi:RNA 3'-terminal phosphate cyclase (ATP)
MAEFASAEVVGNLPASRHMTFTPHVTSRADTEPLPSELDITVEGSASIFLIAMLPYLLFERLAAGSYGFPSRFSDTSDLRLTIRAGTLCVKAPSILYLQQVLLPTFELIGITSEHLRLEPEHEQGWHTENKKYPGKMIARIKPLAKPLPAFVLEHRGELRSIRLTGHAPRHAMVRFEEILRAETQDAFHSASSSIELIVDVLASDPDDQYHLLIAATTESPRAYLGWEEVYPQSDVFPRDLEGDVQEIALLLARSCIRAMWSELRRGNAVDEHTEDILVFYQSVAQGFSSLVAVDNERPVSGVNAEAVALKSGSEYEWQSSTLHRETSWWIVEEMTGVRRETRTHRSQERIGCNGIGLGT